MQLLHLHIDRIEVNVANPREDLGDLTELAASIRAVGLLEPLVLEQAGPGRFRLLAGERRLAAAKIAQVDVVPAYCRSGLDPIVAALVENGHRKSLTPVEQARAMGQLQKEGYSQARIARMTGYTAAHVSARLALLDLDNATLDRIQRGVVQPDVALAAVREKRGRSRKPTTARTRHFSAAHPLAETAREMCDRGGHVHRDGSTVACGRCWEIAIRADERASLGAVPATAVDDVDEIAVRRFVDGDDSVQLSDAEYEEAFRQTVATRGWNAAMARFPFSGQTAARVNSGQRSA